MQTEKFKQSPLETLPSLLLGREPSFLNCRHVMQRFEVLVLGFPFSLFTSIHSYIFVT